MKGIFLFMIIMALSGCTMLEVASYSNVVRDLALKKAKEYCENHDGVRKLHQRINSNILWGTISANKQRNSFHVQCQGAFGGNFEVEL